METAVTLGPETMKWIAVNVTGDAPKPRGYHTAVFHDNRFVSTVNTKRVSALNCLLRLWVFGGNEGDNVYGDFHVLDLSSYGWLTSPDNVNVLI